MGKVTTEQIKIEVDALEIIKLLSFYLAEDMSKAGYKLDVNATRYDRQIPDITFIGIKIKDK